MRPASSAGSEHAQPAAIRIVLTVLAPFALGYFLSYLFRSVNAVVGHNLVAEIGLTAAEPRIIHSACDRRFVPARPFRFAPGSDFAVSFAQRLWLHGGWMSSPMSDGGNSESLLVEDRVRSYVRLGESHFREFKSAVISAPGGARTPRNPKEICRDIAETLVAFANADGGDLIVGIEDDGTVTGVLHTDEAVELLKRAPTSYIHRDTPLPPVAIFELEIEGAKILYFRVQKSDAFVCLTSDGRCLKRFDRQNAPTSAEHIQFDRRELKSKQYDREFVRDAAIEDLNLNQLQTATLKLAPGYSFERFLQLFDLADFTPRGLALKRAALLLFSENIVNWHARCQVRLVRVDGTVLGSGEQYNVLQDNSIRGNLLTILPDAWEVLRIHLTRTRFSTSGIFQESIIYPEEACREALINAIAHRDYSNEGRSIEILVFDDRMEIKNPGNLLSSLSVEDLKGLKRSHQSRNVLVAHILRELGYMREMGEGMIRMFSAMKEHDLVEPELQTGDGTFTVILHHKSVFSSKDVEWLRAYDDFELNKSKQKGVLMGRTGELLSTNQIVNAMSIVDMDVFRQLYEGLFYKGIIYDAAKIKTTARKKRNIPRFRIRPPIDIQQYYDELLASLVRIEPTSALDKRTTGLLRRLLSEGSPYRTVPRLSLRYLGFVGEEGQFLPKAQSLWRRARAGGAFDTVASEMGVRSSVGEVGERRGEEQRTGVIISVRDDHVLIMSESGEKYVAPFAEFRGGGSGRARRGKRVRFSIQRSGKVPLETAGDVDVE